MYLRALQCPLRRSLAYPFVVAKGLIQCAGRSSADDKRFLPDYPNHLTQRQVGPQEEEMFSVCYRATASFSFDESVPICSATGEAEILVWSNPVPYLSTPPVTVVQGKTQNVEGARGRTKRER